MLGQPARGVAVSNASDVAQRTDQSGRLLAVAFTTNACLQIVVGGILAGYPWAQLLGHDYVFGDWMSWIVAVGLHSLWLLAFPPRGYFAGLPAIVLAAIPSFVLVVGLAVTQGMDAYQRIVGVSLQRDYLLMASLLYTAARDPFAVSANLDYRPVTYVQGYFDPLIPIFVRLFDLTSSPFRLIGLHTLALLSAPLTTWALAIRYTTLRPFQILLPLALVSHVSFIGSVRGEYHASSLGITAFLIGSFLFFKARKRSAFVVLLVGSLTKISYWPSWIMFGVVHAIRRQWLWAGSYTTIGLTAIWLHGRLNVGNPNTGAGAFFGPLGTQASEVAYNAVFHSELWKNQLTEVSRWEFLGQLVRPFGLIPLLNPLALLPTLPLVAFSFLDVTNARVMIYAVYAVEYLGFLTAVTVFVLLEARPVVRYAATLALTVGLLLSFQPALFTSNWPSLLATPEYVHEVNFVECARAGGPVLAPTPSWSSYARGSISTIWFADPRDPDAEAKWAAFTLLTFAIDPHEQGSLTGFPDIQSPGRLPWPEGAPDLDHYRQLFDRLPYVTNIGRFRYHGGPELVACAERFGYAWERADGRV
jgi:hypothetical protein